jgi:hypothetical protein
MNWKYYINQRASTILYRVDKEKTVAEAYNMFTNEWIPLANTGTTVNRIISFGKLNSEDAFLYML